MTQPLDQFQLKGKPLSCERYGNGHINQTFLVKTDAGLDYILQRLSRKAFKNIPALMDNISAVTRHLQKTAKSPREVLHLIKTLDNQDYYVDQEGETWRVYDFITDSLCLERPESPEDFYQSALAFGRFQSQLSDFQADTLYETIPRFHDTPNRYQALHEAVREDRMGRLIEVMPEYEFCLQQEEEAGELMRLLQAGELKLRVTHNDTKLNNVMLDRETRKALCVIDLDTVMPGLAANDFGDSIRFGASTATEDERDLSLVRLSLPLYETYLKGFLTSCGALLNQKEKETLPLGAKLMTLECGVRFLTDYLQGDVYFATHRAGHNLDRCRTQFQLVRDMQAHWQEMNDLVHKLA